MTAFRLQKSRLWTKGENRYKYFSIALGKEIGDKNLWTLDRVSRTALEIQAIIGQWKPDLVPKLLLPHGDRTQYFVLFPPVRQEIWNKTVLLTQPFHSHLFDYDAFVIKTKAAVHDWVMENFSTKIQGLGVLFGIIYGNSRRGPQAYNWYLTEDMYSLVFFDPRTKKEYSAGALDAIEFEPVFATL